MVELLKEKLKKFDFYLHHQRFSVTVGTFENKIRSIYFTGNKAVLVPSPEQNVFNGSPLRKKGMIISFVNFIKNKLGVGIAMALSTDTVHRYAPL